MSSQDSDSDTISLDSDGNVRQILEEEGLLSGDSSPVVTIESSREEWVSAGGREQVWLSYHLGMLGHPSLDLGMGPGLSPGFSSLYCLLDSLFSRKKHVWWNIAVSECFSLSCV